MRRSLRGRGPSIAALALLAAAAVPVDAGDRPTLVVWLDPTATTTGTLAPEDEVRRRLDARGFDLAPATWAAPRYGLHLADPRRPQSDAEIFDALTAVRGAPGVDGAGELLADLGGRIRFGSGRVAIRFRSRTRDAAARTTGDALGLGAHEPAGRRGEVYLYRAELRPSELARLQANATLLPSIEWVRPIDYVAFDPSGLKPPAGGRYHRIPKERNVVTILLEKGLGAVPPDLQAVIDAHNGTIEDIGFAGDRWINVSFQGDAGASDEEEMEEALGELVRLDDDVSYAGPAVLGGPPGFVTDQLIVHFTSELDRFQAAPILDQFGRQDEGFEEIRRLPYAENGYLFRFRGGLSYQIYDAARELIVQGLARYALPNLMTGNTSACGDECYGASHQGYLNTMRLCEPREKMPEAPEDWTVRLAVLDEGANDASGAIETPCKRLYVDRVIDFETMGSCEPDPTDWCSDCNDMIYEWAAGHGNGVSLIAAATRADSDTDLVGVAPGIPTIVARRPLSDEELMTDVAFSDALWWLAGGDPEWCCDATNYSCAEPDPCKDPCSSEGASDPLCLPEPLTSDQRADVLNLSFTREDFLGKLEDCSTATELCALVCADESACALIDETLTSLRCPDCGHGMRDGGAVVVAAVGRVINEDACSAKSPTCYPQATIPESDCFQTDLAAADATIAVGSVAEDGSDWLPYYSSKYCLIHNEGSFVDTVAPLGNDSDTTLCETCGRDGKEMEFGASSGATAAVSGIAATLLQLNPALTAEQVHCIVRETADDEHWDDTSGWPSELRSLCEFKSVGGKDHSACLGRGMVDACAAAALAESCTDPESAECPAECLVAETASVSCDDDEGDDEVEDGTCCEKKVVKPGLPFRLGKVIHPLEGRELPAGVRDLLRCLGDKSCYCEPTSGCPELTLINREDRTLRDREARLCFGDRCFALSKKIREWRPGSEIRLPLEARPEMLGYLRLGFPARVEIVPAGKKAK